MAITTSTARNRSLVEYFSALFIAIVAAVSVTIAVVVSDGKDGPGGVALTSVESPSYSYESAPPVVIFYLVDSQEKADGILKSEQELLMSYFESYQQLPARTISVMVATTPEEGVRAEQQANLAAQELMLSGTLFEFVDLRGQ